MRRKQGIPGSHGSATGERYVCWEKDGALVRVAMPNPKKPGSVTVRRFAAERWDEAIAWRDEMARKLGIVK